MTSGVEKAERGLIYGRASRDPRGGGTSVTSQLERGRNYAAREGVHIVAEIRDDNRSASRGSKERPGFVQVREYISRSEIDLLILWEVSRSSRDLEEFMGLINACADNSVQIVVSGSRYDPRRVDEWLPLVIGGVFAEAEARRIKQRNLDSVKTNAARRTPHGRLPYGFRREYDPNTGVLVRQTPFQEDGATLTPEAQVLADAVLAILNGVTLRAICRDLNARGVPSPRKPNKRTLAENPDGVVTTWNPQSLRQLLLNPTIAGRRIHQGQDIGPAAWDPIVDYGTWLRLRAILTDPARLTISVPRGPEPRHLLSGIAKCGECGATMKAATNMARLPRAYTCRHEGCMRVTVSAPRVEERVEAALSALFRRPDFRERVVAMHERQEAAAQREPDVASLIAAKEAELDEADVLRKEGVLSLRSYGIETSRIEAEIEELRARQTSTVASPALRRLITAKTFQDGWDAANLMAQREIVRALLDITVRRATKVGKIFDPERVRIEPSEWLRTGVKPGQRVEGKSEAG